MEEDIKYWLGVLKADNFNKSFIDLVENLIARNKELEDELKRQINAREITEKYIDEKFIEKSKIREKIEALDDIESDYSKKIIEAPTSLVTGVVQYAFRELLEEGDK